MSSIILLGGGKDKGWMGEADFYSDLPSPSTVTGQVWLVRNDSGIWPFKKKAGFYLSTGGTWKYLGVLTFGSLSDVDLTGIQVGQTAVYDGTGFIADNPVPANHALSHSFGGSDPISVSPFQISPQGIGSSLNADMVDGFHASQSPAANQIPVLSSAGELLLPLLDSPIKVGGQDYLLRTFYVDQINGSDSNSGTSASPFKTLTKAITAIPMGGYGRIIILGDYTLDGEIISIIGKTIRIDIQGQLTVNWTTVGSYAALAGFFILQGAKVYVYINSTDNGKIFISDNNTGITLISRSRRSLFNCYYYPSSVTVSLRISSDNYTPIFIGKDAFFIINDTWAYDAVPFAFSIAGHYSGTGREIVISDPAASKLVLLSYYSPAILYIKYQGGYKDGLGNALTEADLVLGVIKDVNGVPRNVISNVIF